jgi:hypothetical protein
MAEDEFVPQSGGLEVKEGHEESDLSVKGIVTFLICLAFGGLLTFIAARVMLKDWPVVGLAFWETKMFGEPRPLTPAEQQLRTERTTATAPAAPAEVQTGPEQNIRAEDEEHLSRTFPPPRLQYDDVLEMQTFRGDEDDWLKSSGKTATGNIHIPIEQAKDLLVKQGLGKITEPFEPPTLPTAVPMVPASTAQRSR